MESQVRDSKRKEITDSEDSSSSSEGDVREVKSKKGAKKSTCEKKKRNKNEMAPDKSTDVLCSKMIGPVLPSTMIGPSLPPSLEKTSRTIIGPVMPELKTSTESSKSIDLNKQRNFTPMTKEEWEKRQSVVRRVYDEVWIRFILKAKRMNIK